MDLEQELKKSLINKSRIQHIVSRIDVGRDLKSARMPPIKRFYVAASIIIVGLITIGISFHALDINILRSSIAETKTLTEVPPTEIPLDAEGNYAGFSNLPPNYTVEDAKKDGYVVEQDSIMIANKEVWDTFVQNAAQGNNEAVRMVSFLSDGISSPSFRDLYFHDGYYYLFDSSSDKQDVQKFSYLLTLEGQFGNPLKDSRVVVLTNDNKINFNAVMKSLLSSSMDYKQSVPPCRLVWINVNA